MAMGAGCTRYTLLGRLGSGGMGSVCLARMTGSAGFSRVVAVKRLHPELAAQPEHVGMLVDEARLASSLHHVNIVSTLDLEVGEGGFNLVLDYIEGAGLDVLMRAARRAGERIPAPIALAIIGGVLRGLDAAHEARSADGVPLGIVHRDISPHNVLVGTDGVPRIIDFGIAKAMGRVMHTRSGEVRGKFAYIAPEQLLERPATRQSDVYSAGVVLWELLTGRRLFKGEDQRVVCAAVMRGDIAPPSHVNPELSPELDPVVLRATASDVGSRFLSARELLEALAPFERASEDEVSRWVRRVGAEHLAKRAELLRHHEARPAQTIDELMAELGSPSVPALAPMPSECVSVVVPIPRASADPTIPPMVLSTTHFASARPRVGWIYAAAATFGLLAVALIAGDFLLGHRHASAPSDLWASEPPPVEVPLAVLSSPLPQVHAAPTLVPPAPAPPPPPARKPVVPARKPARAAVGRTLHDFEHP